MTTPHATPMLRYKRVMLVHRRFVAYQPSERQVSPLGNPSASSIRSINMR